jgi:hypothetical protein
MVLIGFADGLFDHRFQKAFTKTKSRQAAKVKNAAHWRAVGFAAGARSNPLILGTSSPELTGFVRKSLAPDFNPADQPNWDRNL